LVPILLCLVLLAERPAVGEEVGTVGPVRIDRLAGGDRIGTAVAVSRDAFDAASVVVLARADDPTEALAGAPLAAHVEGPMLLTAPDRLSDGVRAEIDRLGARHVVLLGGEAALGPEVLDGLEGLDVRRVAGATRFGTAAAIARELPSTFDAYVVRGAAPDPSAAWPDALAVGPTAAERGRPILLVERDRIPGETADVIDERGYEIVRIVGGENAVSGDVERGLKGLVDFVNRAAGATRYETAATFYSGGSGGSGHETRWIATGRDFADALVAGPAIAATGGKLVLADGRDLLAVQVAVDLLRSDRAALQRLVLLGGPDVITDDAKTQLEEILLQDDLDAPRCDPEQLRAAVVSTFSFEGGNPAALIEVVNIAAEPCTLVGRPRLAWLDANGEPLPTRDGPTDWGDGRTAEDSTEVIPLAPRGRFSDGEYGRPGSATLYVDRFVFDDCDLPRRENLLRARLFLPHGGVVDSVPDPPTAPFDSEGCIQVGSFEDGGV